MQGAGAMKRAMTDFRRFFVNRFSRGTPTPGEQLQQCALNREHKVEQLLSEELGAGIYYVEIGKPSVLDAGYGDQSSWPPLAAVQEELERFAKETLGCQEFFNVESLDSHTYVVVCGMPSGEKESLPEKALTVRLRLKGRLEEDPLNFTGYVPAVRVGYAYLDREHAGGDSLYETLCAAQRSAMGVVNGSKVGLLRNFKTILNTGQLRAVYQPIVDLETGDILAWESLIRGPAGSRFESPRVLFDFAEDMGEIFHLERTCREAAISHFDSDGSGKKLFLNIHPKTLLDENFSPGETSRMLHACGLSPLDIVLEITERHAIQDFNLFLRALDHYRSQGYRIAIDDAGAGYSGLRSIAEFRPDYIKIDMSLVRGVDSDPVKRALLETFVTFADRIGCKLVAEGIETALELSCLMSMGVHYGQGYYLARPGFPKPAVNFDRGFRQRRARRRTDVGENKCAAPLRDLADPAMIVDPDALVCEVKHLLSGEEPISALVVARDNRPVGLVMSYHMDRALSSQYGMSLYYNRSVARIMDPAPLVLEGDARVDEAARQAMNRPKHKLYDHIVVTEQGMLKGLVLRADDPGLPGSVPGGDGQGRQSAYGSAGEPVHRAGD